MSTRGRKRTRTRRSPERLTLPPAKIRCSVPAEDAIKAAIADYRHEAAELATVSAEREKVA